MPSIDIPNIKLSNIKLQSSDGEIFDADIETVKCFGVVKTMLEGCAMDDDGENAVIPLPNVNSDILRRVLHWADYHKNDPEPNKDNEYKEKSSDDISPWDIEFFKVDQDVLFELIFAANYLDIKGLLEVGCKTVANLIKGKTVEEIRNTFNIQNDFTAEEEEQLRRENQWVG